MILSTKLCNNIYIYILTVHSAKQKGVSNITGVFIMSTRLALWPELNLLGLSQPQGVHWASEIREFSINSAEFSD